MSGLPISPGYNAVPGDLVLIVFPASGVPNGIRYYELAEIEPQVLIVDPETGEILPLVRYDWEWQVASYGVDHIVIFIQPPISSDLRRCNRLYESYKDACDDLWRLRIKKDQPTTYYIDLIDDLAECRHRRILHSSECAQIDEGHLGAIIKMSRLLSEAQRALDYERHRRIDQLEDDIQRTVEEWPDKRVVDFIRRIPRIVLIEFLLENSDCVSNWWNSLFGEVLSGPCAMDGNIALVLEQCTIPNHYLIYLLLTVADNDTCLRLEGLLFATSSRVKQAYRRLGIKPLAMRKK